MFLCCRNNHVSHYTFSFVLFRFQYLHNALTHDFVISGKVEVWTLGEEGTIKTIYGPRQYFTVEAYVPHILYFLEDTNMAEWYEGPSEFRLWYYHPYRNIVVRQSSKSCDDKKKLNG